MPSQTTAEFSLNFSCYEGISYSNEICFLLELNLYLEDIKGILPSKDDIDGSTDAIIRLQEAYKLDARSLVALCSGYGVNATLLTLDEIYQLGRNAFLKNKLRITREWMMLALEKVGNETSIYSLSNRLFNSSEINYNIDIRDHLAYVNFQVRIS